MASGIKLLPLFLLNLDEGVLDPRHHELKSALLFRLSAIGPALGRTEKKMQPTHLRQFAREYMTRFPQREPLIE